MVTNKNLLEIFKNENVRKYFFKEGFVNIFSLEFIPPDDYSINGRIEDFQTKNVRITFPKQINHLIELKECVSCSGFSSFKEWIDELRRLYKITPEAGWLYTVTLLDVQTQSSF